MYVPGRKYRPVSLLSYRAISNDQHAWMKGGGSVHQGREANLPPGLYEGIDLMSMRAGGNLAAITVFRRLEGTKHPFFVYIIHAIDKHRHNEICNIGSPPISHLHQKKRQGPFALINKSLGCLSTEIGLHRLLHSRHFSYMDMPLVKDILLV